MAKSKKTPVPSPTRTTKGKPRKSGPKGGRPKIVFDLGLLRNLAQIQCTYEEMAAFFKCGKRTIEERAQNDPEFRAVLEEGKREGLISIRRQMMRRAMAGSDTMLIWLSKNLLGYTDRAQFESDVTARIGVEVGGVSAEGLGHLYRMLGMPAPVLGDSGAPRAIETTAQDADDTGSPRYGDGAAS